MRVIAIFATLLAVAFASPHLEARQQGEACQLVHGATCESKLVLSNNEQSSQDILR